MIHSEYKHILKVHEDILTVHLAINELYKEFEAMGYEMLRDNRSDFMKRKVMNIEEELFSCRRTGLRFTDICH